MLSVKWFSIERKGVVYQKSSPEVRLSRGIRNTGKSWKESSLMVKRLDIEEKGVE